MNKFGSIFFCCLLVWAASGSSNNSMSKHLGDASANISLSEQNLIRAMELTDNAISAHFTGEGMAMARYYNPFTGARSGEKGSVWMYTSAIEAVNAIIHGLKVQDEHGNSAIHDENFERYADLLHKLYENADYYLGSFKLTSYTQTKVWTVYGVHRSNYKGTAKVEGIENVYDDQMWFIRELLESYKITKYEEYLKKAEYLTDYVLDGWDTTRDANGEERGGIPWGPGYVSKHSCSNGPMVSPLVWLSEIYKDEDDQITHRYIDASDRKSRKTKRVSKSAYYLEYAQKIYDWQKKYLLRNDGVYADMMGGCTPGKPETENIDGKIYRKGITCTDQVGEPYTYNSGTMLSGAADLLRVTGDNTYYTDAAALSDASFNYFASPDQTIAGYYAYDIRGFRNWFNGVLMRAYVDIYPAYQPVDEYISTFQQNLDYGYENFLHNGILPGNLLEGWNNENHKNKTEGMFSFTFAAEYAVLSRYILEK